MATKRERVFFERGDEGDLRPLPPGWVVFGLQGRNLYVRGVEGMIGSIEGAGVAPAPAPVLAPTVITQAETFAVATNRQALYFKTIRNEGLMKLDGYLVGVQH